jgi:CubicO group peptidase (beta-lactamase class C family)
VRHFCCLISLCLFFSSSILFASDEVQDYGRIATIDLLMERAISNNLISGGVVVIGDHTGILSSTARGRLSARPEAPLLNEQTIFDLASLTKVIATAPAVMKLLDEGRISLQDPLTRWFPEFKGSERENITILHLLTHTSGLADFDISTEQPMNTAIYRAAAEKNRPQPGSKFKYADINFILLGELVHRVSGKTLDVFCREEVFDPLVTSETMFLPTENLASRIAPTLGFDSGTVQDRNARRLGSVAGHAGLFSSAQDLARFARLMLDGGEVDGKRILSERVVKEMTTPILCSNGAVMRGLGWDIHSPYSAPKGKLFSEASYGHTGYSGSSIWIDPKQDLFVVLLTNRLDYRNIGMFNQLRSDISTIAVAEFRKPGDKQMLTPAPERAMTTTAPQRKISRGIPAASRGNRVIAAVSGAHHKTHSHFNKKICKNHYRKSYDRTHRCGSGKRRIRCT